MAFLKLKFECVQCCSYPEKSHSTQNICVMRQVKGAGKTLTPLAAKAELFIVVDVGGNALTCLKWGYSMYLEINHRL